MNTFLPFPSFVDSVRALDDKRLGKQRVEAMQIQGALIGLITGETRGWQRHPATLMWEGYLDALVLYKDACILEWVARGFNNTMTTSLVEPDAKLERVQQVAATLTMPPWLGHEPFHESHRSNLVRKAPDWYASRLGWRDPAYLPYLWPRVTDGHPIYTEGDTP